MQRRSQKAVCPKVLRLTLGKAVAWQEISKRRTAVSGRPLQTMKSGKENYQASFQVFFNFFNFEIQLKALQMPATRSASRTPVLLKFIDSSGAGASEALLSGWLFGLLQKRWRTAIGV